MILAEKLISFQKHPVEKYIYKQKINTTMLHDCEILNMFEKTYPTEQLENKSLFVFYIFYLNNKYLLSEQFNELIILASIYSRRSL